MNENTPILNEWDFKIIKLFKSCNYTNPLTTDKIIFVWGERCWMDTVDVNIEHVCNHFLLLAQKLGLFNVEYNLSQFIFDLRKTSNWKYVSLSNHYLDIETDDFNLILLSRLDSLFSLTDVVKLPGYAEWTKAFERHDIGFN